MVIFQTTENIGVTVIIWTCIQDVLGLHLRRVLTIELQVPVVLLSLSRPVEYL
jgi:hypothetical protein